MQRKYREKKYYCGDYLEVSIYPVYFKAKGRGKRSKPTTEIQQRLNQRHTEGRLRRLLHTNFTPSDLFATLTFDEVNLPASVEDAQRLLQNFLRRLKRKYSRLGLDAKYIYVLEYGQEHNRLHIHLVLTGGITRADLEKLWGLGLVSADALRFEKDGLATLAKYLAKGGGADDQGRPTWKRWSGSRNLEQPTVIQRDGRLSHRKMADLCQNGGETDYLETLVDGYEMADFSLDTTQDIYGGYYLAATLKKIPTRADTWSGVGWLPFG
jgi:hypothetical protein